MSKILWEHARKRKRYMSGMVMFHTLLLGYYNHMQNQSQNQGQSLETSHDMQVKVTGTIGICWRKKTTTVSREVLLNWGLGTPRGP